MKKHILLFASFLFIIACSNDDDASPSIDVPQTYTFERNGESTISFGGQTTRIEMAEELISAFTDFENSTATSLSNMFTNTDSPFADETLNTSSKTVRSKTATSTDYFASNTVVSSQIKADFDAWISKQVSEVFPAQYTVATQGNAGQIADGTSTRYVNAKGLEYNQAFNKALIGALMTDQALNNYLSTAVLNAGSNIIDNDVETVAEGKNYTTMEHKWDEAYGYLYGSSTDKANPNITIGADDSFLNKYIGKVNSDDDFNSIATTIYDAFKLGRAAIVAKQYDIRDEQAEIIRENVSKVIGVRAVYYLQAGKNATENGAKFHDLSEGFGFIYSLQFTRKPNTDQPYFTKTEIDDMINQLMQNDGFWSVSDATLDEMSNTIASRFGFTVEQACN